MTVMIRGRTVRPVEPQAAGRTWWGPAPYAWVPGETERMRPVPRVIGRGDAFM